MPEQIRLADPALEKLLAAIGVYGHAGAVRGGGAETVQQLERLDGTGDSPVPGPTRGGPW